MTIYNNHNNIHLNLNTFNTVINKFKLIFGNANKIEHYCNTKVTSLEVALFIIFFN